MDGSKPKLLRAEQTSPYVPCWETQGRYKDESFAGRPVSRLGHGSSDVGSTLSGAGIAGKVVVLEGTLNPSLAHAIRVRGDTEGDVCGRGSVLVLAGGPETFEGGQDPQSPSGRKRSLLAFCLPLLLSCFVEPGDLLQEGLGQRVLLSAVALQAHEWKRALPVCGTWVCSW